MGRKRLKMKIEILIFSISGLVIQCLIRLEAEEMNDKCKSAVEHWQIISLKDWHFSYQFKTFCGEDIGKFCAPQQPQSKAEIVACLSEIARNDILMDKEIPTLKPACKKQLKFQLLQKHSSLKLNPRVAQNCKKAIKINCPIGRGNVLECLKSLDHRQMSKNCRAAVFEEEEEEVLIKGIIHKPYGQM